MSEISRKILKYEGPNPFSDSQPRNFSDSKIINEFCPVSNFWSLFSDQHEVLLGTRGSGKTFLLKMMRYSMLKRIVDPQAEQLIKQKKFIALYLPMHLEFVTLLIKPSLSENEQVELYQFAFNCLLAESLITELVAILEEETDEHSRAIKNVELALKLDRMWFPETSCDVSDLFSLKVKITSLYFNFDIMTKNLSVIPPIFRRQICSSLIAVKEIIFKILELPEEPTWIICIDEAEFLKEPMQRCINNVFRSDSRRIALKVATLPFYHTTLKTLEAGISVSPGNDFNYRVVDLKPDSADFKKLSNSLCSNRLKERFCSQIVISRLEDFLGTIGEDDQFDYFREEFKDSELMTREQLQTNIQECFPKTRRKSSVNYNNPKKTILDKYAPIYFVRRMFAETKKGNYIPGWYAGSRMIRQISQGNPRAFIQIMNDLFERARKSDLTPKVQHDVLLQYAHSFCESTRGLEIYGPTIYKNLEIIGERLRSRVHGEFLVSVGSSFTLEFIYSDEEDLRKGKEWIQLAIAYSRILVDDDTIIYGIKEKIRCLLSNAYAANYWLPMRADNYPTIRTANNSIIPYTINTKPTPQLSMFEEEITNDFSER
jgi:hypothetical protein